MTVEARVIVTRQFMGICHMQVCAVNDATDAEILEVCNRENVSGTTLGWCRVVRGETGEHENQNPVACNSYKDSRTHYLVAC